MELKINKFGVMLFIYPDAVIINFAGLYLRLKPSELPNELDAIKFYEIYNSNKVLNGFKYKKERK